MSKQKRIVCYAINGAGLGHVTRLLSVAKWMRRYVALLDSRPAEVLFLTSSDASDILAEAGFAAFKIPSKTIARRTELNKLEYRRLAKHFVWNTLGVFAPDLLVVDTFPSGSFDEMFQVLDGPFKKSFIYRKVKPEYAARATFRSAAQMYDAVVAPHSPENFSIEQLDGKKIQFSGEVVQFERADLLDSSIARRQLGVADGDRLVYVSAGGGGDPNAEQHLNSLARSLSKVDGVHLLVGAGPLYRGSRISGPKMTWYDGPGIGKYFAAVDAALCAAGYNTFHELLLARVPTAFFAQHKIADDQLERIQQTVELGACRLVKDVNDEEELVSALSELLTPKISASLSERCESVLPENSARQCALQLIAPMYEADRLKWVEHALSPKLANRIEHVTGSATGISEWLVPLMPLDQARSVIAHPAIDSVLGQLSLPAAAEVRNLLAKSDEAVEQAEFETQLVRLFDIFSEIEEPQRAAIASETLKTILAAMKKNTLEPTWTAGVFEIVRSITQLIQSELDSNESSDVSSPSSLSSFSNHSSISDLSSVKQTLQLYRTFPRLVDATANESFQLFVGLVESRRTQGEPSHVTSEQLQVLKMTHSRVTKAMIEDLTQNIMPTSEADLHG